MIVLEFGASKNHEDTVVCGYPLGIFVFSCTCAIEMVFGYRRVLYKFFQPNPTKPGHLIHPLDNFPRNVNHIISGHTIREYIGSLYSSIRSISPVP